MSNDHNWINQALDGLPEDLRKFVTVETYRDSSPNPKTARTIRITVQDEPVGEIGVTGMQCGEMIQIPLALITFLNQKYPCRENVVTMGYLAAASLSDKNRTADRVARGVEGKNEE